MASVSQNGRRARRPWTAQDQIFAEVAAACGVSCREIAKVLKRDPSVVRSHLDHRVATKRATKNIRWRESNPQYYTNWVQRNRERKRENEQLWAKNNPEKVRQKIRRWRNVNPEWYRLYCQAHPDVIRENSRRRNVRKRAARRQSLHPVTRAQIDARFALWNNRCAFCGVDAAHERNHGRKRLAVEHVLALANGGLDEKSNLVPACTGCNSSKSDSLVEDWYLQQPWFTEARWRKIQRHCPSAVVGQLPLSLAA